MLEFFKWLQKQHGVKFTRKGFLATPDDIDALFEEYIGTPEDPHRRDTVVLLRDEIEDRLEAAEETYADAADEDEFLYAGSGEDSEVD